MLEKKVLIIAYYWPPSGGSGVQRWLKFVKYLPQFGCKPYVFTPKNPAFAIQDPSLIRDVPKEAEVIHFPIWEPYSAFIKMSALFGSKAKVAKPTDMVSGSSKSFFQHFSTWIRGNVIIPDPRVFWVRPSVRFLHNFIAENKIETIITTGPPHSMHLIGYHLKKKNKSLKWMADFRDPWTEWGLLDSLMVGSVARKIHRRLESKVLAMADEILTITPFYVRRFEILSRRKVQLLTNGFDEENFDSIHYSRPNKFTIRHVGIVNEKCDPRPFMEAIKDLVKSDDNFRSNTIIEFTGEVHPQFIAYVNADPDIANLTYFHGNIPHQELLKSYGRSSLLLIVLHGYKDAEGFMPGKLFEYMATGIPIVGVGPVQGDASHLLKETQSGIMLASDDLSGIKESVLTHFNQWKAQEKIVLKTPGAMHYSRRLITKKLADMIKAM